MDPLLVVYDADCGVCQASVEWLRKRDRRGRLRFAGNDGEIPAGISREETEHIELWERFTRAAGATSVNGDERVAPDPLPETLMCARAWSAGEHLLEHLAVLYAIEAGQPEVSSTKLEGLVKHYGYKPLEIAVVGGSYRSYGFTDALTFIVHRDNPIAMASSPLMTPIPTVRLNQMRFSDNTVSYSSSRIGKLFTKRRTSDSKPS